MQKLRQGVYKSKKEKKNHGTCSKQISKGQVTKQKLCLAIEYLKFELKREAN